MNDHPLPLRAAIVPALLALLVAACGRTPAPPPDTDQAEPEVSAGDVTPTIDDGVSTSATDDEPDGPAIVRRHVLAAGGDSMPEPGTSRTFTFEMHFTIPGAAERRLEEPSGTFVLQRKAPNLLHTRTVVDGIGASSGGFDGEVGWASDATGVRFREGASLAELAREAIFDREIHLDLVYPTAVRVTSVERDGVECWLVRLTAEDGTLAQALFRKDNGLMHELVRQLPSPQGPMGVIQRFHDWTDFGGRLFPTRIETRMGGTTQTMVLVDVDDAPLDRSIFAPPSE